MSAFFLECSQTCQNSGWSVQGLGVSLLPGAGVSPSSGAAVLTFSGPGVSEGLLVPTAGGWHMAVPRRLSRRAQQVCQSRVRRSLSLDRTSTWARSCSTSHWSCWHFLSPACWDKRRLSSFCLMMRKVGEEKL